MGDVAKIDYTETDCPKSQLLLTTSITRIVRLTVQRENKTKRGKCVAQKINDNNNQC